MAIDKAKIEEYRALLASCSPFAVDGAVSFAELRRRISETAPKLWQAASALIAEVERLRLLVNVSAFLSVDVGIVTCQHCHKTSSLEALKDCYVPEREAHFDDCPAPWTLPPGRRH